MKKLLLLLSFMVALPCLAQPRVVNLWSGAHQPRHVNGVTGPESSDQWGHLSAVTTPTISVYLPQGATKPTQAVLIVPGGGYEIVSSRSEGQWAAEFLAKNGVAGIVLKYRLPNGVNKVPLEDALRAMKIVRDSARVWNINRHEVGVMGFSAGGHLASTLATKGTGALRPAFSVLYYPVITMCNDKLTHGGSRYSLTHGDSTLYKEYSSELNVKSSTGRTLIFHCLDDDCVPIGGSELYVE
ncbi:MAG: alpha/beta hydrolase, partial [Mucinivorans sp.]